MYKNFLKINGDHAWREVCPEGYIDYPARIRKGGRVLFFNFPLARETGLIARNHPPVMTPELEEIVLKTFSLRIINEYDQLQKTRFPGETIKERPYMATRYLQAQHRNKQGKTSGDGRSIWNGSISNGRMTFDLSSCGTGATILSPGAQEAGRPLKTGETGFGYASGLADLEEMFAAAVMSEIFYRSGIPTERCLAVIDFKNSTAIGVRTAPNLVRPAHIFRYLKSGLRRELKASMEYFLKRQEENGFWTLPPSGEERYQAALQYFARTYAKLSAVLEEEYIFNWLAWDGDNMLASGALLDYGSIRQFAAKHNKYRYEDVDRFSTSLTEQRFWARKTVQTFAQAMNWIVSEKNRPLADFRDDPSLSLFDSCFIEERLRRVLWRTGFTSGQIEALLEKHTDMVREFQTVLNYFEDVKTADGVKHVPDGIDHPPVFLVRHILRELPQFFLKNRKKGEWLFMPSERFCRIMAASYIDTQDLQLTDKRRQNAFRFQELYRALVVAAGREEGRTLLSVARRSSVINYIYRRTGDGLVWVIHELVQLKDRMKRQDIQDITDRFIESQVLVPGKWKPMMKEEITGRSARARYLR
ncbi:MAG: hypothetical protein OEU95_09240, partial [Nitrospirota bacterium]|nr:hypothetical protein [Nitrospirota bacterium]